MPTRGMRLRQELRSMRCYAIPVPRTARYCVACALVRTPLGSFTPDGELLGGDVQAQSLSVVPLRSRGEAASRLDESAAVFHAGRRAGTVATAPGPPSSWAALVGTASTLPTPPTPPMERLPDGQGVDGQRSNNLLLEIHGEKLAIG